MLCAAKAHHAPSWGLLYKTAGLPGLPLPSPGVEVTLVHVSITLALAVAEPIVSGRPRQLSVSGEAEPGKCLPALRVQSTELWYRENHQLAVKGTAHMKRAGQSGTLQ